MRFLFLIGLITWHVTDSNAMAVVGEKSEGLKAVADSANTFAPNFFKTVAESKKGNLICSPISASMVLSLATYGARGNTEKQMRSVLALPEKDEVAKTGFQAFIDNLNNYNAVELRMANKMFVADGIEPKTEFKAMAQTGFRSEAQNVNFAKSAEASKTINDWCEEQTNHKIKDLIKPDAVDASTAMVLVNAVYFKGNWSSKFDPAKTQDRPFHIDETQTKNVSTMFRSGSYRYGKLPEVKASFVEIPYKSSGENDAISMIVILPDEINGLAELEKNIEKVKLETLLRGATRDVNLYLPKFKIESDLDLNPILSKMGMSDMFTNAANFTGIVDAPPLKVSSVVQKAFIEVNEEGSEAAAATGVVAVTFSLVIPEEPPVDFIVDRPAHFIIATNSYDYPNSILFSGSIHEPMTN